jgi:hypothetical protein
MAARGWSQHPQAELAGDHPYTIAGHFRGRCVTRHTNYRYKVHRPA